MDELGCCTCGCLSDCVTGADEALWLVCWKGTKGDGVETS